MPKHHSLWHTYMTLSNEPITLWVTFHLKVKNWAVYGIEMDYAKYDRITTAISHYHSDPPPSPHDHSKVTHMTLDWLTVDIRCHFRQLRGCVIQNLCICYVAGFVLGLDFCFSEFQQYLDIFGIMLHNEFSRYHNDITQA